MKRINMNKVRENISTRKQKLAEKKLRKEYLSLTLREYLAIEALMDKNDGGVVGKENNNEQIWFW